MERIVYLERESIIADIRRPACDHVWSEYARTLQGEVEARLAGATIAIVNKLVLDAATIARLPMLKMIAVAATGTNNVDLDACRARGIVVSNIRGYAVHTVPEHAIALMLALSRNLVAYRESVQAGRWQESDAGNHRQRFARRRRGAAGRSLRDARAEGRAQGGRPLPLRLHAVRRSPGGG